MKTYAPISDEEEIIGKAVVNAAYKVHKELGSGLLEKVYEVCMAHVLTKAGFDVKRQVEVPITFEGLVLNAFRLDLLVNNLVICELKAVEVVNPVWNGSNH